MGAARFVRGLLARGWHRGLAHGRLLLRALVLGWARLLRCTLPLLLLLLLVLLRLLDLTLLLLRALRLHLLLLLRTMHLRGACGLVVLRLRAL